MLQNDRDAGATEGEESSVGILLPPFHRLRMSCPAFVDDRHEPKGLRDAIAF